MDTNSRFWTLASGSRLGPAVSRLCATGYQPLCLAWLLLYAPGCAPNMAVPAADAPTAPAGSQPGVYDTTAPRPIEPRDWLERLALERGGDLKLVDKLMDERTRVPEFQRQPLPTTPADTQIGGGVTILSDANPFPEWQPVSPKEVSIRFGLARSTFRTRTPEEALSAVQPFLDIVQREVNVRSAPDLYERPADLYFALSDGKDQLGVAHVFDYLLVRSWLAEQPQKAAVILAWAQPANPRTTDLDRAFPGIPGTGIELVVAAGAPYQKPADLKGARLALAANYVNAPGAFLTRLLADLGQPPDQPFFSSVALRRYSKDCVIDVIKGKADAACVDQGTVGALDRFYGLSPHIRTLAVSPRYNVDVLFTSLNNLETHRTEIELTQNQLTTLNKNPEGEEVLFFFDIERWYNYRVGDLEVPRQHFDDFARFLDQTPVDLKPLLDPAAPVDGRTYDRFGDE